MNVAKPEIVEPTAPWVGAVPPNWRVVYLRYLLARNDGGVWGTDFDQDGTVVLRSTEQTVDGDWRIESPARRALTTREKIAARLVAGDLLVTKSSGSSLHIGKTSLVTDEIEALDCCFSNFMQRLRCGPDVESRFLQYVLNSRVAREQFAFLSNSTTGLANLSASLIGNVRTAVPPVPTQRAIAVFLDRETARIDALVKKKERLIELLEEKRAALISRAVTQGLNPNAPMKDSGVDWLGEVPAHWDVPPLYARFTAELGKMLDEKRISGHHLIPYLRNVDVQWDAININELPQMDIQVGEYQRYTLCPGDLLVCEGGEVGRAAVWTGDIPVCGFQKALHRIRPRSERDNPRFLFHFLKFAANAGIFLADGSPNTIAHLTAEKLRRYRLPSPPRAEQDSIVAFVDSESSRLTSIELTIHRAIDRLREYRTALISAAVTGKIDVRGEVAQ